MLKELLERKRHFIPAISIIVLVFLFLGGSRTMTSGFHFVDDHEIIRMKSDLKSMTLSAVAKKWVMEDINSNIRFRPIYYVHRVVQTRIFGSDFLLWSFYNALLACLALIFSYLGMRQLGFTTGQSALFVIVAYIGPQAAVWWRLGPGESLGMVFLALSFFVASRSAASKYYLVNNILFALLLIILSLVKESFTIIIPGLVAFKIWYDNIRKWQSVRVSVSKNILLIIPLLVVGWELYYIKSHVGIGYSGLDSSLSDNIRGLVSTTLHFGRTYLYPVIALALIYLISAFRLKIVRFRPEWFPVLFFLLVAGPNAILYAKTGMNERYLLPSSFALAFLLAAILKRQEDKPIWFRKAALYILFVSFLPFLVQTFRDAAEYAADGRNTQGLLKAVMESNKDKSAVLLIADPVESYEASVSLKTYLHLEFGMELYGKSILKKDDLEEQAYLEDWQSYFKGRLAGDMKSKPEILIFLDSGLVDKYFNTLESERNNYIGTDLGKSPFKLLRYDPK